LTRPATGGVVVAGTMVVDGLAPWDEPEPEEQLLATSATSASEAAHRRPLLTSAMKPSC
jgi:hypothetical protein